jgi:hypothetical protein
LQMSFKGAKLRRISQPPNHSFCRNFSHFSDRFRGIL